MEIKKSYKADLERKRAYFFLIGLIISGTLLLISLEWKYGAPEELNAEDIRDFITLDEEIQISDQSYEVPPEIPLLPEPPVYVEIYDVVENSLPVKMPDITSWEETPEDMLSEALTLNDTTMISSDGYTYVQVDKMPEFPGSQQALILYLARNIRYPESAVRRKISGRIICSFVVDKNGKITQAEIIQGLDPALDQEALRVINRMPNWRPGENKGKKVKVKYLVPLTFRL